MTILKTTLLTVATVVVGTAFYAEPAVTMGQALFGGFMVVGMCWGLFEAAVA